MPNSFEELKIQISQPSFGIH